MTGNGVGNGADRPLGHTGNPMIDQSGSGMGSGWMHQVTDRAQGVVRSARDSGGAMLDRAGESAGRVADQVGDMFERHPLLIGAIGMLAGGLLAALLPSTRVEDEWFGPSRDQLWNRAEKAGKRRSRGSAMSPCARLMPPPMPRLRRSSKETDKPLSA